MSTIYVKHIFHGPSVHLMLAYMHLLQIKNSYFITCVYTTLKRDIYGLKFLKPKV